MDRTWRASRWWRSGIASLSLVLSVLVWTLSTAPSRAALHRPRLPLSAAPAQQATSTPAALPLFDGYTAAVSARDLWRGSGVALSAAGEGFVEVVGGCWTYWLGGKPYNRGEGDPDYICSQVMPRSTCTEPMPDEPKSALIGRLEAAPFAIGRGARFLAPRAGALALRMNDSDGAQGDNDGSLYVRAGTRSSVDARQGWQPASLTVAAGTRLVLQVRSGEWTHSPGSPNPNQGQGVGQACALRQPPSTCAEPLPNAPTGSLIGRIGGQMFAIGSGAAVAAPAAGDLWLRLNEADTELADNNGRLELLAWPRLAESVPQEPACAHLATPTASPSRAPTRTATASPTRNPTGSPTASPSPTIAATPTATATTTATTVPSATPFPPCVPESRGADIALVLDRSSSMDGAGKLEAARAALLTFVGLAKAPPDQLSLVTFANVAGLNQPLTTDKARLRSALEAVITGAGTRIDLGLASARQELTGPRRAAGHGRVIVLLTDGIQTNAPAALALAEAAAAKAAGVVLFTIGLGPDADLALLGQVASSPAHSFVAPSAADLIGIYERISAAIPCSSIGGQVYVDRDEDGRYDPAVDAPLPDARIDLAGPVARSTRSSMAARVNYLFDDIPAGAYTVSLDLASLPSGLAPMAQPTQSLDLAAAPRPDIDFGLRRLPVTATPTSTRQIGTPATPTRAPAMPPTTTPASRIFLPTGQA